MLEFLSCLLAAHKIVQEHLEDHMGDVEATVLPYTVQQNQGVRYWFGGKLGVDAFTVGMERSM